MRILLDECIDWRLARAIVGHEVRTAHQMGWRAIGNGELLTLASAQFDAFVTVDRSIAFQQHIDSSSIAIVVLRARTNRLADLRPLVPALLEAVAAAAPGNLIVVEG